MANVYRTLKDIYDGVESYAVYSASGVETGSAMAWDPGARVAVPMTAITASGAIFLGVSEEAQPVAGLGSSSNPLTGNQLRIRGQGVCSMQTTSGEVYSHLDPVWLGANSQTVSLIANQNTRFVGRAHLPLGNQVTGGVGVRVPIRILGNLGLDSVAPVSAATAR